ncbi:MAG: serine/threonine protein kinase [Gemmataceae bacterium]|nr:serine/threonine protein kinase [Gemmataceae bacterium]
MARLPQDVGKPGELPKPSVAAPSPAPEGAWESLGSTRVIEGDTPTNLHRKDLVRADSPLSQRETKRQPSEPAQLGDFQLLHKIGEGAMGAVYKAWQASFGRHVALKILFPHIGNNPKLVERLYREGCVMGQLDHPNIVQAYGVDEDQGRHYVALEFIDGQSMQKWLAKLGRIALSDALHIVLKCADALDYAHRLGLVHRDIKPDNILITKDGDVKVADLGMVKQTEDDEEMALTQTGHAVGTPWYMPLEQAKNAKETDRRSDIYALGCMLYCFITGAPPFAGKTLLDVIRAKETGSFPPARQVSPEVPERLDLIITKMTAKLPKYRYQTCEELIHDLEGLRLASARLSFLDDGSAEDTAVRPAPTTGDLPVYRADPNVWYVRAKDADGRKVVHQLTTPEVQEMLENDTLGPNNKASHDPSEGFRALATYREFQNIAFVKASRQSADDRSIRYRTLYKKIEEQANEREKANAKERDDTPPWLPLAIKFGGGGLAVLLLIMFFWWLMS